MRELMSIENVEKLTAVDELIITMKFKLTLDSIDF